MTVRKMCQQSEVFDLFPHQKKKQKTSENTKKEETEVQVIEHDSNPPSDVLSEDLTKLSKDNSSVLHYRVTEDLLSKKEVLDVAINLVNDEGYTPLLCFMKAFLLQDQTKDPVQTMPVDQFLRLVSQLLAHGEDPNAQVQKLKKYRDDPELIIKDSAQPGLFKREKKASFFLTDLDGRKIWNEYGVDGLCTVLHLAAMKPILAVFNYLLKETEVDPNIRNFKGETVLLLAIQQSADLEVIRLILDSNANPNLCDWSGRSPILLATENGNSTLVKELLFHQAFPEVLSVSGDFPLKSSVFLNDLSALKILLNHGADPNFCDRKGRTGLHYSFSQAEKDENRYLEASQLLIESGASLNAVDRKGRTPLHYIFAKMGSSHDSSHFDPERVIQFFLKQNQVEMNLMDTRKRSPLHYAAQRGSLESVKLLLSATAEFDTSDEDGNTPLCLSVLEKHPDVSKLLILKGANVNSPVHVNDTGSKKRKELELVMEKLAKVNDQGYKAYIKTYESETNQVTASLTNESFSLFRCALKQNLEDLAISMISAGFDRKLAIQDALMERRLPLVSVLLSQDQSTLKENLHEQNLFHLLALYRCVTNKETTVSIATELLKRGVDPNKPDSEGCTPLHYACKTHFIDLIDFLRLQGGLFTILDNQNQPPLFYAIRSGMVNYALPTLIALEGMVDFNIRFPTEKDVQTTPLIHAIDKKAPIELITYLIDHSANVSAADSMGKTVLMHAICVNNELIVNKIVKEVDVNAKDFKGKTALHYVVRTNKAGSYENRGILALLEKNGADLDVLDDKNRSALFYAGQQESGVMFEALVQLGAKPVPAPVSSPKTTYPLMTPDYVKDAEEYITLQRAKLPPIEIKEPCIPDDRFKDDYRVLPSYLSVLRGSSQCCILQVWKHVNRPIFMFYQAFGQKHPLSEEKRSDFGTLEEAVDEFKKAYFRETGNQWGQPFTYMTGKSLPIDCHPGQDFCISLKDLESKQFPTAVSNPETLALLKDLFGIGTFSEVFLSERMGGINFSLISSRKFNEARETVVGLKDFIKCLSKSISADEINSAKDGVISLSKRLYDLLPFHKSSTPLILTVTALQNVYSMLTSLEKAELRSQILIGALHQHLTIHPLDYCYSSLQCELHPLSKTSTEYQIIYTYAYHGGCEYSIDAIYTVSRLNEDLEFSQWKKQRNRMLLWHGSSALNIISILRYGLKLSRQGMISVPGMFGKGIYFADTFIKSLKYTAGTPGMRYLLLCEVALGHMELSYSADNSKKLSEEFQSVKGCGEYGPDLKDCFILKTGAVVPFGEFQMYPPPQDAKEYALLRNEYVVYDESQVRIRYLVQIEGKT